jgi:putative redox protein
MADVDVMVRWLGDGLRFAGGAVGGPVTAVDGNGKWATSPVNMLAVSLAACTAADIVEILGKMRVPLEALAVNVDGDRRPEPPRRYTRIHVEYRVRGVPVADEEKLRRAVMLSHETYCSVLHSLRDDIEMTTSVVLE